MDNAVMASLETLPTRELKRRLKGIQSVIHDGECFGISDLQIEQMLIHILEIRQMGARRK